VRAALTSSPMVASDLSAWVRIDIQVTYRPHVRVGD
jgi:hypothetical protein